MGKKDSCVFGQLLRKKIGKWLHFGNISRKQSSNIGGAKTTGKTFRKEVLEEETRVDAANESRVPKTQPLGEKAFIQCTRWDGSGDMCGPTLLYLPTLESIEQWQRQKDGLK